MPASKRALNTAANTMPNSAMAINPAVRAVALLMPDALPACSEGTAFITAVVSGATKPAAPMPSNTEAGKKVVQ